MTRTLFVDITGKKFGMLTVIQETEERRGGYIVWDCECECGNHKKSTYNYLKCGITWNCGCIRKDVLPKGEASKRSLLRSYKQKASNRGIEFLLSDEEFFSLTLGNCYYCGESPSNIYKDYGLRNGSYVYNGVDRVDSSGNYEIENCVTCCRICNTAKNALSKKEFKIWISKVYKNYVCEDKT